MGNATTHMVINILGVSALLLIAVRYSSEMSELIGSTAGATTRIFSYAAGFPDGQAIPAAPLRG